MSSADTSNMPTAKVRAVCAHGIAGNLVFAALPRPDTHA